MTLNLNPKQSLFLWNLILADGGNDIGVKWSETKPELKPAEKQELVDAGYLNLSKRGRSRILTPAEGAWSWAERSEKVELLKSSAVGAVALERLLHRLLPLLRQRGIALAELFSDDGVANEAKSPVIPPASAESVAETIEQACLDLAKGARQTRVKLRELRFRLPHVARETLDRTLLELQRQKKLVLYREDNTAALAREDHEAALLVGNEPRHLVLLEA